MLIVRKRKAAQRRRSPTNAIYLETEIYGEFHHLYEELRNKSRGPQMFYGYARILPYIFDYIDNPISKFVK
jgi:hypothetical protein